MRGGKRPEKKFLMKAHISILPKMTFPPSSNSSTFAHHAPFLPFFLPPLACIYAFTLPLYVLLFFLSFLFFLYNFLFPLSLSLFPTFSPNLNWSGAGSWGGGGLFSKIYTPDLSKNVEMRISVFPPESILAGRNVNFNANS